jgi:hypothetical protein
MKYQRNWDVPLVLLERSPGAEFNGIYFVRFGLRRGRDVEFKVILFTKNSNKSQKTKF